MDHTTYCQRMSLSVKPRDFKMAIEYRSLVTIILMNSNVINMVIRTAAALEAKDAFCMAAKVLPKVWRTYSPDTAAVANGNSD